MLHVSIVFQTQCTSKWENVFREMQPTITKKWNIIDWKISEYIAAKGMY